MIRAIAIATVILIAIICTPNALKPGFNSADIICILAPLAVLAIMSARRRPRPVSHHFLIENIDENSTSGWTDDDKASIAHLEERDH